MRRRMFRLGCIVLLGCTLQFSVLAQEIKVSSGFTKDSVALGEPISYYLTARYPESVMALFPDSTFKFSPFEFGRKQFFPTKTTKGISYDSAVYTLSTFEIDRTQYLSLPVFVTTARDCTAFESARDSVFLIEQIKIPATDTVSLKNLPLKSNTLYERVFTQFNTFILGIVIGVIVIAGISTWVLFGERIRRYFQQRRLQRRHAQFTTDFISGIEKLQQTFSPSLAEQTVLTWKKYMEQLTEIPYTKYTTHELKGKLANSEISTSLSAVDRMVYGQIQPESLDAFAHLKIEAENLYEKKIIGPEKVSQAQFSNEDITNYVDIIRSLPCPVCGNTTQKLNGTIVYKAKSFILFSLFQKQAIIACPSCLTRKNNEGIFVSALAGWWGFPWGFIKTPQYIYLNVQAKKKNRNTQPNTILTAWTLRHAGEIEVNKDSPEKLTHIIRTKKKWWQS